MHSAVHTLHSAAHALHSAAHTLSLSRVCQISEHLEGNGILKLTNRNCQKKDTFLSELDRFLGFWGIHKQRASRKESWIQDLFDQAVEEWSLNIYCMNKIVSFQRNKDILWRSTNRNILQSRWQEMILEKRKIPVIRLSIEALRQLAIIKTTLKMQLIKFDFSWFWAENRLVVPAGDQWIQILVFEFHIRKILFANSTTTICVGQDSKDTINFTWFRTEKQWKQACHAKYQIQVFEYPVPMPVSPSWVSGISARHFQNCLGFDKLWILRVWPATFKYQTGRKIRNQGTPSTMQACSFFSNLLLEFCFSTPAFSSTILLHKLVQAFDTLKIPTGSQEASVPTWNPRMLWQYGESRALEPLLPPPSLNWGPAAIYCSGQTGIGSRLAVRGPLVLPWIWLQRFSPGRKIHPHTCPHWWCLRKSTLCHLFKKIDTVHISAEAFLGSPDQCREYPLSTIY